MSEQHVTPVTQIKRQATKIIARLQKTRSPVLITQHGKSAAVLLDVRTYERLLRRLDVLQGILQGERAIAEGRVLSEAQAEKRLARWLKPG